MRDNEPGVPLYVDIQLIDTNTCAPLSGAALDFWHCNSTGVYSGVSAAGNGGSDADDSNLDATFNRGIQETSSDGVAQFITTFPGHYMGRATHIHIMSHSPGKWTKLENNTITGNTQNSHVGQLFFDSSLIDEVEKLAPYNTNTQPLTTNAEDFIMAEESADVDPIVEYVLLGDKLEDGILAWVSVAVNASATFEARPAVNLTADGGVVNPGGMRGPGGGPGCGGGPPPGMNSTGGPPSGMRGGAGGNRTMGGPGGPPGGFKCDDHSTETGGGEGDAPPAVSSSASAGTGKPTIDGSAPVPSATLATSSGGAAPSATPSAGAGGEHGQDCDCEEGGKPGQPGHGPGPHHGEHHGKPPSHDDKMRPDHHQSHWEYEAEWKWEKHGDQGKKQNEDEEEHDSDSDDSDDSDDDSDDEE